MAKAPYFPFYVRDWMCSRKVMSMSGDAVKAFVYLLCESWLQEPRATLPDNDQDLASMARVSVDEWMRIKDDVLRAFNVGECKEHQGRLYSERLLEASRKSESNQRFGNKNAKRTRTKRKVNTALESENESESDTDIKPESKPNTNNKEVWIRHNGREYPWSFRDTILKWCGDDWYLAERVMYRAVHSKARDLEAWIRAGFSSEDQYIRITHPDEDYNKAAVNSWIEKVFYKPGELVDNPSHYGMPDTKNLLKGVE